MDAFEAQGESVLMVEDDPRVRRITVRRLADLGYTVADAESGPAAMRLLQRDRRFDLLFTDVVMPGGMDGIALAREARRLRPEIKVVFASGFADPKMIHAELRAHGGVLLRKPYTARQLAQSVRKALAS